MNWHRIFADLRSQSMSKWSVILKLLYQTSQCTIIIRPGKPWPEHIALAALATPNGFYMDGSATQIPHGTVPEATLDRATGLLGALHATFA